MGMGGMIIAGYFSLSTHFFPLLLGSRGGRLQPVLMRHPPSYLSKLGGGGGGA